MFMKSYTSACMTVMGYLHIYWVSPVTQTVKMLPAIQEIQVQSLHWKDLPDVGLADNSSILAWRIPWIEKSGRLQSMGL